MSSESFDKKIVISEEGAKIIAEALEKSEAHVIPKMDVKMGTPEQTKATMKFYEKKVDADTDV